MAVGQRVNPYLTSKFSVQIGGLEEARFAECSGLQVETEVFEYQEGGRNDVVHRLPGRSKISNVTLKRGIALTNHTNALWDWYSKVVRGTIERKHVSIVLYDLLGEEVMRWHFDNCYPVKWSGPSFKADENTVTIETLELTHTGMRFEPKSPGPTRTQ